MKKLFVVIALITVTGAFAKGGDTAVYRRPYYLGAFVGYNGFTNGVLAGSPDPYTAFLRNERSNVYSTCNFGMMLAFPFAKRCEAQLALEGERERGWTVDVTDIHPSVDPGVVSGTYDRSIHHSRGSHLNSRIGFAYEAWRKNNFAILGGVEGWCAVNKGSGANYNNLGLAIVAKVYLPVSHGNGAVPVSLVYGMGSTGQFVGIRTGFYLKGMRIYKHKPEKYYTRTYEDD